MTLDLPSSCRCSPTAARPWNLGRTRARRRPDCPEPPRP